MDETTLDHKNIQDYYVQQKLNGIYGRWDDKKLYTSGDNEIVSVPHINRLMKGKPPCEGELYKHGLSLQKHVSLIMPQSRIDEKEVIGYFIHDDLPKFQIKNNEELKRLYQAALDTGMEGLVITHKATGKKYKIKPVLDMEATLIGFNPAVQGRNLKTFGALILQLDNGIKFKCSGIKDVDRETLWKTQPIGCRINFNYRGLSDAGTPLMAKYGYIRTDK